MIRLLQILIGFYPILFITTYKSEDVHLTQQVPSKVETNESIVVEIKVDKTEVEGFAKFQVTLPEGFSAEQIDTKGATFTFDQNTVKIIWLALPKESEFVFTYKIIPLSNAPNTLELAGRFSYLEDNNRVIAEVNKETIEIGSSHQPIAEEIIEQIPATAQITRDFEQLDNKNIKVTLTVTKSGIQGFAKLEELLPSNYIASSIEDNNGVFSSIKNKVKYVWMNIPNVDSFSVSYKIESLDENFDLENLTGTFSFLDNNETKKIETQQGNSNVQKTKSETEQVVDQAIAEVIAEQPTKVEDILESSKEVKTEIKKKPIEKEAAIITAPNAQASALNEADENKESAPIAITDAIISPNNGITYKVQILAGKNVVNTAYFTKNHQYEKAFDIENHEGWVKYTSGSFDAYKIARNQREDLNSSYVFPGPFVTAYNNGQRITVQEALMVSNQKWYK